VRTALAHIIRTSGFLPCCSLLGWLDFACFFAPFSQCVPNFLSGKLSPICHSATVSEWWGWFSGFSVLSGPTRPVPVLCFVLVGEGGDGGGGLDGGGDDSNWVSELVGSLFGWSQEGRGLPWESFL